LREACARYNRSVSSREVLWVEQWKRAAVALAEQKKSEPSQLTDEKALAASEALLSLAPLSEILPARAGRSVTSSR